MDRIAPVSLIGALLLVFRHIGVAIGDGSTYSLALLGLDDVENPNITYTLVFTSTEKYNVTATIEDLHHSPTNVVIPTGEIAVKPLTQHYALNGSAITNKTVHVTSVNGTFNLQVFSKLGDQHVEGFLAIPRESLLGPRAIQGTYEYITTTFCAISGFCQFAISVFEDNTDVSVEFKTTTEEVVMCNRKGYFRSHRDKHIFLDKFDSVQFESAADLTGVRIYSFKPIAVFVGSRNVTQGDKVVHMVEQLNPSSQWGTKYAVRTLGNNSYGDILKISTYWPNTTIDMEGFPVFVATKWSHNVWRRLYKGLSTFITASRPIQVVQITGLAYTTADNVTSAGMTVVPAMENGANRFKVSCGAGKAGEFHIVSGAHTSDNTSVNGVTPTTEKIAFTQYGVGNINASARDVHVAENTVPDATISGIVKCEETAVMPLGLRHQPLERNTTNNRTVNPTFCKEMVHATTKGFDPRNTTVGRHEIVFGEFRILQLRVRTCSALTVQFLEDLDKIGNYTLFVVRSNTIYIYKCYPHCNESATENITSFKTAQFDCKVDMSLYWFRLVESGASHYMCFGPGPLAPRDDTCTDGTEKSIELNAPIARALMRATPGGAVYNYDLETEADCEYRESSWRCEDKSTVCEEYGPTICTREEEYAQSHCAKFCKLCKPDSYGRKFLVLKPPEFMEDNCYVYVTGYRVTPNVAVATNDTLLHVEKAEAQTKIYACTPNYDKAAIVVFADADVSVSVVYNAGIEAYRPNPVMSYPVSPVDSFGREYLMAMFLSNGGCSFVAERSSVSITWYFILKRFGLLKDRVAFDAGYNNVKYEGSSTGQKGLFQSDAPFTVVCGSGVFAWSTNQMTPTETWGTRYVVPELETTPGSLPFDPKITITSNRNNTVINIDGDFNAVHTTRDRGETVTQNITGRSPYKVTSSHPVGVALVFKHQTENETQSVHILPPSDKFTSTQLLTVPNAFLETLGMAFPNSIATYLVTTAGVSTKEETTSPSAGEQFDTRFLSAGAQFGISMAQTDNGEWLSLTGHQTYDHYTQTDYCQTSMPAANDSIDNDCDSLIDEDTCYSGYGVYSDDFDLDGGFNEDCCCKDTNAAILGKPTEPQCLEVLKPANQCWTNCRVNCAWLTNLENYERMTEDEKTALNEAVAKQLKKDLSVNQSTLSAKKAAKESATDERASAREVGLVGVGLFAAVFGSIFVMDIRSLIRDIMLTAANIREGFGRLRDFIRPRPA